MALSGHVLFLHLGGTFTGCHFINTLTSEHVFWTYILYTKVKIKRETKGIDNLLISNYLNCFTKGWCFSR